MRAASSPKPVPSRFLRWRPLIPLLLSVAFGTALVFITRSNRQSVEDTAERARRGRAVDLAMQAKQAVINLGFVTEPAKMRAGLRNVVQGPVEAVALTTTDGRVLFAHPSAPLGVDSRRLVRTMHSSGRAQTVVRLRSGPHPTYEIVLMLKPELPDQVRTYFDRHLAKLPPEEQPGWDRALGPRKIYVRTVITVHDDASLRAVRRAKRTQLVGVGVAALLLIFGLMAVAGDRRMARLQRAMQRHQALAEMGEMAAVLAHEIRNPVGVIKGRAQLLLEEGQTSAPKTLRSLVDQSERLERLIDTLLEFARPSPPRPEELDGERVVEEAVEAVAELAVDKQVAIVPDAAEGRLRADPDQVHRSLVNLLRNSLEATPEQGRITVKLRFARGMAVFTVTDTGPGFPEDLGDEMFKPFVTTRQKGSGLGLAVVRRIVDLHGGEVSAGNSVGGGAQVELRLPLDGPVVVEGSTKQEASHG